MVGLEASVRLTVPKHTRHLIRLRASHLNGCEYCRAMHRKEARADGWTDEQIMRAEDWVDHASDYGSRDTAILRLTDAVTHIAGEESVPDELWDAVVAELGSNGAGQTLMEIVTINAWNRIAVTTRMDPSKFE